MSGSTTNDLIDIYSRDRDTSLYPDSSVFRVPVNIQSGNISAIQLISCNVPNVNFNVSSEENCIYIVHGSYFAPSYFTTFENVTVYESIVNTTETRTSPVLLKIQIDPGFYTNATLLSVLQDVINSTLEREGVTGENYTCEVVPYNNHSRIRCTDANQLFSIIPHITTTSGAQSLLDTFNDLKMSTPFTDISSVLTLTGNTFLSSLGLDSTRWHSNFGAFSPGYVSTQAGTNTNFEPNINTVISDVGLNLRQEPYLFLYILEFETTTQPQDLYSLTKQGQKDLLNNFTPVYKLFLEDPIGESRTYKTFDFQIKRILETSIPPPLEMTIVWAFRDRTFCSFRSIDTSLLLKIQRDLIIGDENEL